MELKPALPPAVPKRATALDVASAYRRGLTHTFRALETRNDELFGKNANLLAAFRDVHSMVQGMIDRGGYSERGLWVLRAACSAQINRGPEKPNAPEGSDG